MPSVAQQIREALMTEIQKVSGLGDTGYDWEHWADVAQTPGVFLLMHATDKQMTPTRSKTAKARFVAAVVLRGQNLQAQFDTVMANIENQIEDDPSLGGLCGAGEGAFVTGCGPFATDPLIAAGTYVRGILIEVEYRHARAAA